MGRRRKGRKVIKRKPKTLPKIFKCPQCGRETLSVDIREEEGRRIAHITCGSCNLEDVVLVGRVEKQVDAYAKFLDKFYGSE